MDLRTEKEVLIDDLNRANKLCEEATLGYMNMCKQVEVLEKCIDKIEKLQKELCRRCEVTFCGNTVCYEILQKIKEVKGNE